MENYKCRGKCSIRKQPTFARRPLFFPRYPRNDVWETTVEVSYWWCVTIQIYVVLLIGWSKFPLRHGQKVRINDYSDLGSDMSSVWNFWARSSVLRRHFMGKSVSAVFSAKRQCRDAVNFCDGWHENPLSVSLVAYRNLFLRFCKNRCEFLVHFMPRQLSSQ